MWQELVHQVGILWIIFVFLATAVVLVLAAIYYFILNKLVKYHVDQYENLFTGIRKIKECKMDNLPTVVEMVDSRMGTEFSEAFERLALDSNEMYRGIWIPEPASRISCTAVRPKALKKVIDQPMASAVLLGGIIISVIAFSSAYILYDGLLDAAFLRLVAVLPFVIGALAFLWLRQMRDMSIQNIRNAWKQTMVEIERHLPVFNQAAETAVLLFEIKDYDKQMAESAQIMSDQVRRLASGQLTESISNAVKYVMSANLAPAIMKSTDALSILAHRIEKQIAETDTMVVKLYTELEHRQRQQAELWLERFKEHSSSLGHKQQELLVHLAKSEEELVNQLSEAQSELLGKLVTEQQETVHKMSQENQGAWQNLRDQLTSIVQQLADGQSKLLEDISQGQQSSISELAAAREQTSDELRLQLDSMINRLQTIQTDVWQQLAERQGQAYDQLLEGQQQSFTELSREQRAAYDKTASLQQSGLSKLETSQQAILGKISQEQTAALAKLDDRQAEAIEKLNTSHSDSLASFRAHQEEIFEQQTARQQAALRDLSENFSGDVSRTLSQYLDPVTTRLHESAESLIAAQEYASSVRQALQDQHKQSTELQETIRDLFIQLGETRSGLTEDLVSLKQSSTVMSEAAESMSSVYAGSQAGLSEAISQMSQDLSQLSTVLSTVMEGSAEQTRQMQGQALEIYETNQKHLDAVRGQITILSDELATRIDQLMIGFGNMTEELVKNIDETINTQNDTVGSSLKDLTEIMGEEARSMSLFAQEINMDINSLNENLRQSVSEFDSGMRNELSLVLSQFDKEVTDVVKRLSLAAIELGDAVEALPEAMRQVSRGKE